MWAGVAMGWILFAIPCAAVYRIFSGEWAVAQFGAESAQNICVWALWWICDIYIVLMGTVFYLRYRRGKWKTMSVIEN